MKRFVRIPVVLLLLLISVCYTYGQKEATLDWSKDSIAYINTDYYAGTHFTYDLKLTIPSRTDFSYGKIIWGDGGNVTEDSIFGLGSQHVFRHQYQEGVYKIAIFLYNASENDIRNNSAIAQDTLYRWILNRKLDVNFTFVDTEDHQGDCLSFEADTFLIHLTEFDVPNPPHTRYSIGVKSKVPLIRNALNKDSEDNYNVPIEEPGFVPDPSAGEAWVRAIWANQRSDVRDSVWLIFYEATGRYETSVHIDIEYPWEGEGNKKPIREKSRMYYSCSIYERPDLRMMYRTPYSLPFPDTTSSFDYFDICGPADPSSYFHLDGAWLKKYQTPVVGEDDSPDQTSRNRLLLKYYYTDSTAMDMEFDTLRAEHNWINVSRDQEYVLDTALFFNKAGFYTIRMEAWNQCNPSKEEHDTLWTHILYDQAYEQGIVRMSRLNEWRYFRVYENVIANLVCTDSLTLCRNKQDTVVFVDRNRREFYDPIPDYRFEIMDSQTNVDLTTSSDYYWVSEPAVYKQGTDISADPKVGSMGCDSVVFKFVFKKPGNFQITWSRLPEHCDEGSGNQKEFEFHIGDVPQITSDTLRDYFSEISVFGNQGGNIYHCGRYDFAIPDLKKAFHDHNRVIDSVRFQFTKGDVDTAYVYRPDITGNDTFYFDRTGSQANYIRLNLFNGCGISKTDSMIFYTPVQPGNLSVWRDGMPDNDTLCLGADYRYELKGVLPEKLLDSVKFSGNTKINGMDVAGGAFNFPLYKQDSSFGEILHKGEGEVIERYVVLNKEYPKCKASLTDTVVVVASPSALAYGDTVAYCASIDTLRTRLLFSEVDTIFNRAEWGWTHTVAKTAKFPELLFRDGEPDTLTVTLLQSKGCYLRDTLIFKPQPLPDARLGLLEELCTPDTLNRKKFLQFAQGGNLTLPRMIWGVYKNTLKPDSLLYYSSINSPAVVLTEQSADSMGLIYTMQNVFGGMADFMDNGCISKDTLALKIHKPLLRVLKKDTLDSSAGGRYDLSRIDPAYIRSKDLLTSSWTWTPVGDGMMSVDTPPVYTLGTNDRRQDSIQFVVSGKTRCNEDIRDTLVVYIPRIRLYAHRDTICSNTEDYTLWGPGKTTGDFVDTSLLEWKIINMPSGSDWGHLSPVWAGDATQGRGSGVVFVPGPDVQQTDSVEIEVTGVYTGGISQKDTLKLWVNPAPEITVTGWNPATDTLLFTENQRLNIGKIKGLVYTHVSSYKAIGISGWIGDIVNDTVVVSSLNWNGADRNNTIRFKVEARGLPGCGTDSREFYAIDFCRPKYEFKYNPLVLCPADGTDLDTIVHFRSGKDKYTHTEWEDLSGAGHLTEGHVYTAGAAMEVTGVKFSVYKKYEAYTGDTVSRWRGGDTDTVDIQVHGTPQFVLGKRDSTICAGTESLEITKGVAAPGRHEWVRVLPGEYVDSLRFNGQPLRNGIYTFRKGDGETDTVRISVDQGKCHPGDTSLYLHRLEKAVKGVIPDMEVCEKGQITVDVSQLDTTSSMKSYVWGCDGNATLSSTTVFAPEYSPGGYGNGTGRVTIYASSVKEYCGTDSVSGKVMISRLPEIKLEDDTVCKVLASEPTVRVDVRNSEGSSGIEKIEWLNKSAGGSKFGETLSPDWSVRYPLTADDITRGYVEIVAVAHLRDVCAGVEVRDTMRLTLQDQVVCTPKNDPWVCEGSGILLTDLAEISHAAGSYWIPSEGEVKDGKYWPKDNNGWVQFEIDIQGLHGCTYPRFTMGVMVNKAPLPEFRIMGDSCEAVTTTFEAIDIPGMTVDKYKWEIEGQKDSAGSMVSHVFTADGDYPVKLTQVYTYAGEVNTCERSVSAAQTIYPKPVAEFTYSPQVSANVDLTFINQSMPADILTTGSFRWTVEGDPRAWMDVNLSNYRFPFAVYEGTDVTLYAATKYGCKDTMVHRVVVVEAPVADFEARVDSCGNTADFTLNTSQLNGAAVWWDWGYGNGWEADGRADLTQPLSKSYFVGYGDTVYTVRLELRNAADTVQKEVAVRFISKLDVDFEILPETSGCHDIYRKIAIEVKGKADDSYVDWGDESSYTVFDAATVGILQHRFENTTPMPLTDTIRLKVSNSCYADSAFRTLKVLPLSVSVEPAIVGNVSPCFGPDDELKVRNASVGFDEETREWGWKFESDADALVQMNADTAVYSYPAPGIYKVTLWMKDRCNEDTSSVFVTVRGNDSLYFDILARPYCTGKEVTMKFTQKGHPDFGDLKWTIYEAGTGRSVKTAMNVTELSHKFDKAGDYHVLLYAKADDCPDQQTLPLHINETPEPMISLINGSTDRGCEPWAVEFQAADGSGLLQMPRILWDFRNEVASSQQKEKVEFRTKGVYDVTLTLTSDSGCVNTDHRAITVLHSPRIDFVLNDSLFCTQNGSFEVTAANVSEDLDSCRFEWFKKIGTGVSESIANTPQIPPLNFSGVSGPIDLKLQATYLPTGCPAELVKRIVASDKVTAAIYKDVEHVCLDYPVYFASRSENATRVRWDMGDGNVTVDTAFEYTYSRVGDYNIRLTVENEDGCQDSVPLSFTVYPLPVADFVWKKDNSVPAGYPDSLNLPEIDNGGVEFTNYSTVSPDDWGTELHYRWDFGDSTGINTAKDPVHHFANNGMYEVWLKTITRYGCVDSSSSVVSIDAVKGLYLPTAFAPAMPDEELGRGNDYRGAARFQPKGIGLYYYKIQIYDPWSGTCVWSSEALDNGQPAEYWDGKFNGADLPAGNYIWKVKAIFIDGTVWMNEKGKTEGNVILIR